MSEQKGRQCWMWEDEVGVLWSDRELPNYQAGKFHTHEQLAELKREYFEAGQRYEYKDCSPNFEQFDKDWQKQREG